MRIAARFFKRMLPRSASLLFVSWIAAGSPTAEAATATQEEMNERLEPFVNYLNEFSAARRLNAYFANPQSIFYGAQAGNVNVGRGNFTFLRRDLVTVGRIPLVVARVYDSSLAKGADFGRGWRLTAAEEIFAAPDGSLVLIDESASRVRFVRSGGRLVAARPSPSDIHRIRHLDEDGILIELGTGFSKFFTRKADSYLLTEVVDRNGNRVSLEYDEGRLVGMSGGNGRRLSFERNAAGRIDTVRDEQDRSVSYRYDDAGQLSEVLDLGGNGWRYQYDASGRMTSALDPLGNESYAAAYDVEGRVRELRSPAQSYLFTYRAGQTLVTDGNERVCTYSQNQAGITVSVDNPLGVTTRLGLDGENRVRRLFRNDRLEASMSYDGQGNLVSLSKPGEGTVRKTVYRYDEQGRLTQILSGRRLSLRSSSPLGFRYDGAGNLVERIDGSGVTHYDYSREGDLTELVSKGTAYRFEHDADGQLLSVSDAQGRTTRFEYHPNGKLARTRFADGTSNSYLYDSLGMRSSTEYDFGAKVEYSFNPVGSLAETRVTNPDGMVTGQSFELDDGQRIVAVEYFGSPSIRLGYDGMGNVISAETPSKVIRFGYDPLNRLVDVVTTSGEKLDYVYAQGEPDLRLQLDSKTGSNLSRRISSGQTFGSGVSVLRDRPRRAEFATVYLDPSTLRYSLAGDHGLVLAQPAVSALRRMRVLELGAARHEDKIFYEQPSNALFIPAEYRAVNCCPECEYVLDLCECLYQISCYFCGPSPPPIPVNFPCNLSVSVSATPSNFRITTQPAMPTINATASTIAGGSVNWSGQIFYSSAVGSCSGGPNFNSPRRTASGSSFSPNFGGFYGNDLRITANCSGPELNPESQQVNRTVAGNQPSKPLIRTEIGNLGAPFQTDDLKRIACQESLQRQFLTSGQPLLGAGGDAGVMQICFMRQAAHFWNWRTNIAAGRAILNSSLARANQVPGRVRNNVVRGMGPFPNATNFTNAQSRLEAIHRYNAGTAWDSGYWRWDNVMGQWVAQPQGGVGGYANAVVARSPIC